jgi:hypothetical protein
VWWRRRQCVKSTASDQRQRRQVATLAPQAVVAQAASTQCYTTGIVLQRRHQQRVEQQQQPQRAQSRGRSRRSRRSSSDRWQCVNESRPVRVLCLAPRGSCVRGRLRFAAADVCVCGPAAAAVAARAPSRRALAASLPAHSTHGPRSQGWTAGCGKDACGLGLNARVTPTPRSTSTRRGWR